MGEHGIIQTTIPHHIKKEEKQMKAILMSIRTQHACNIMNGIKPIELRTRFPKDFRGWVYGYITKGKPYMGCHDEYIDNICDNAHSIIVYTPYGTFNKLPYFNGKVAFRFWVDNVEEIYGQTLVHSFSYIKEKEALLKKACLENIAFGDYVGNHHSLFAIHISKLEVFDKPKELGEFYYYTKRLIDCGMDCKSYFDEVKTQVRKAPQSYMYVEVEDDSHNQ